MTAAPHWKGTLYQLQLEAPKPILVPRPEQNNNNLVASSVYGLEYHGNLDKEEVDHRLKSVGQGAYLVRDRTEGLAGLTLCILFDGEVRKFRLFYEADEHFVGEKRFSSVHDLVADGLIHFFVESRGCDVLSALESDSVKLETPYYTIRSAALGSRRHVRDSCVVYKQRLQPQSLNSDVVDATKEDVALRKLPNVDTAVQNTDNFHTDPSIYEKRHLFKTHTFKGPHWCDLCGHFLWGLIAQGQRCLDCGCQAHRRCAEKAPKDCLPDMKFIKRIFGSDLTTLVKAQAQGSVPAIVRRCVTEIESRGMRQEGIYRLAGFHDDVEWLKLAFDKESSDNPVDLGKFDDVNTITSVLKSYLRMLPIPLIPFSNYQEFISHDATDPSVLRQSVSHLPPVHKHTLSYLCLHWHRVVAEFEHNKMSANNLGIVLAPTVLRPLSLSDGQSILPVSLQALVAKERNLVSSLIQNASDLFL